MRHRLAERLALPVLLTLCLGLATLLGACAQPYAFVWQPHAAEIEVLPRTAPAMVLFRSGSPRAASLLNQAAQLGLVGDLTVSLDGDIDRAGFEALESALAAEAAARGGDVVVVVELAVAAVAEHGTGVGSSTPQTTLTARVYRGKKGSDFMREFVQEMLFVALEEVHLSQLERVIAHSADLDAIWHGGETPLTASIRWKRPADDILLQDDPNEGERNRSRDRCVERLLAAGADPNQPNLAGVLPLMLALEQGEEGLAQTLRRYGAVKALD